MDSFYFNLLLGFQHVLDFDGLDHLFFIVVLVINHTFKIWRKTFIWVTFFTLGHTISLFFGNYYKLENLQTLCKKCHRAKTNSEVVLRGKGKVNYKKII